MIIPQSHDALFKLIDIPNIRDSELKKHTRLGILEYLFKHIRTRDLLNMVGDLTEFLIQDHYTQELVKSLLIYCYQHGKIERPQEFIDTLLRHAEKGEGEMMTLAEYLRQQGWQEGEQKGKQEGSRDATLMIAKNLLIKGVDLKIIQETTGLSQSEINQLF